MGPKAQNPANTGILAPLCPCSCPTALPVPLPRVDRLACPCGTLFCRSPALGSAFGMCLAHSEAGVPGSRAGHSSAMQQKNFRSDSRPRSDLILSPPGYSRKKQFSAFSVFPRLNIPRFCNSRRVRICTPEPGWIRFTESSRKPGFGSAFLMVFLMMGW